MTRTAEARVRRIQQQFREHVGRPLKNASLKTTSGSPGEQRQIADARLDQVLEEVRAEGQVPARSCRSCRDFYQERRVVDVRIRHPDSELDVAAASPAPGPDQRELARSGALFSRPTTRPTSVRSSCRLQLVIPLGVDVDDVGEIGDAAVGDELPRGEEHLVRGHRAGSPPAPHRRESWARHCSR